MGRTLKSVGIFGAFAFLSACADPGPLGITTLARGEQVSVRSIVEANPGKRGCVDYDAATQSCSSLTRTRIVGNTLIGEEITAVQSPTTGKPVRIVVATRGRIVGQDACVKADGVSVGRGTEDRALTEFAVGFAKELVKEAGEVCASYYKSGDSYVLSSRGSDGKPFPPGDTSFRILDGPVSLRLQQ